MYKKDFLQKSKSNMTKTTVLSINQRTLQTKRSLEAF